jgi:hypothetical protein
MYEDGGDGNNRGDLKDDQTKISATVVMVGIVGGWVLLIIRAIYHTF